MACTAVRPPDLSTLLNFIVIIGTNINNNVIMALNPAYEAIGKGFVQQYYALFDDPAQRPNLINMYNVSPSTLF